MDFRRKLTMAIGLAFCLLTHVLPVEAAVDTTNLPDYIRQKLDKGRCIICQKGGYQLVDRRDARPGFEVFELKCRKCGVGLDVQIRKEVNEAPVRASAIYDRAQAFLTNWRQKTWSNPPSPLQGSWIGFWNLPITFNRDGSGVFFSEAPNTIASATGRWQAARDCLQWVRNGKVCFRLQWLLSSDRKTLTVKFLNEWGHVTGTQSFRRL